MDNVLRNMKNNLRERIGSSSPRKQLCLALNAWWKSNRPISWDVNQHRKCPEANLQSGEERDLSKAFVAAEKFLDKLLLTEVVVFEDGGGNATRVSRVNAAGQEVEILWSRDVQKIYIAEIARGASDAG
jgi:hypothetical protein